MTRQPHAHPDPTVRYLAHEVAQPVDKWGRIARQIVTAVVGVACIAVFGYAVLFHGAPV